MQRSHEPDKVAVPLSMGTSGTHGDSKTSETAPLPEVKEVSQDENIKVESLYDAIRDYLCYVSFDDPNERAMREKKNAETINAHPKGAFLPYVPFDYSNKKAMIEKKIDEIIKENPNLVLTKVTFEEAYTAQYKFDIPQYSFIRDWDQVSPLEYLAWIGEETLLNKFLKCLPESLKTVAQAQLKNIKVKGSEAFHCKIILHRIKIFNEYSLASLLQFTAKSKIKECTYIIAKNPEFILKKGSFVEKWCGQREWKEVSPLEYAAWAGDTFLVNAFLKYIPKESLPEAYEQLKNVKQNGTEHGKHLSAVTQLIQAYDDFFILVNKYLKPATITKEEKEQYDKQWVEVVGKAQLHSVVNLLNYMVTFSYWSFCDRVTNPIDFTKPVPYIRYERWEEEGFGLNISFSDYPKSCIEVYRSNRFGLCLSEYSPLGRYQYNGSGRGDYPRGHSFNLYGPRAGALHLGQWYLSLFETYGNEIRISYWITHEINKIEEYHQIRTADLDRQLEYLRRKLAPSSFAGFLGNSSSSSASVPRKSGSCVRQTMDPPNWPDEADEASSSKCLVM